MIQGVNVLFYMFISSEDNMNYMHEDQYGGPGHGPYSGDYNSYNGGPHHDTSLHSSHVSLQSTGSNRNRAQVPSLVRLRKNTCIII